MKEILERKYNILNEYLKKLDSLAVAFSGGVDSTFLLKAAHDILGDRAVAITAVSCLFPQSELYEAQDFCHENSIKHIILQADPLSLEGFSKNPPDRCYICKRGLFERMIAISRENGIKNIAEGSNVDDMGDYRPGMRAIAELDVKSPLREAGLYKKEIRDLSRYMNLKTWDKPSFACLASRFAYGEQISREKLAMVGQAEEFLRELGFYQTRVRIHDMMARIEVMPDQIRHIVEPEIREMIYTKLKEYGFTYITLDLAGYRTGSMNEILKSKSV